MILARLCALALVLGAATGAQAQPGIIAGPIEHGGHQYFIFEECTWTEGEAAAAALGGHLITVNDAAENEWVHQSLANLDGIARSLWIGLNDAEDEGVYVWASGEPTGFTNWYPGEPSGGGENYVHMYPDNGKWNDNMDKANANTVYGTAEIPVACYPDISADGVLDLFDFLAFVNLFNASDPAADCDDSGGLDLFDFLCFTNLFNAGC